MCWLINQSSILTPITCRAGVQARVRGEGEGAGQVLAQARLHRHEIPLRLPTASLYLQVHLFLSVNTSPLSEARSKGLRVLVFNNCLCLIVYHFFPQQRSIEKLSPFPKFPDNEVCLLPSLPVKFKEGRYSLNSHWNLIKVHQTQIRAEIKLRRCLQRAKSEPIMFYVKLNTPNV